MAAESLPALVVPPTKYAAYGAVPASAAVPSVVTVDEVQMLCGYYWNDHLTDIASLLVTDTAGSPIARVDIAPRSSFVIPSEATRFTGLKHGVTGGTLYGQLTGFPTV